MEEKLAQITFLGTGTSQGVPPIGCTHPVCLSENPKDKRLRTSALISINKKKFVIDCGPDFRQQMLRENVVDLEAIIFTHEHNDHVSGLDDIRALYFLNGGKNIPLFCPKRVEESIRQRFAYFFAEKKYPGVPEVDLEEVNGNPFTVSSVSFRPLEITHGHALIYGYQVGGLVYITDASAISDEVINEISDCDVLVLNALRKEPKHYSHFTLGEALEIVERVRPNSAYFTHISHYMGFHDEVEGELPESVHLAYDGLSVPFSY